MAVERAATIYTLPFVARRADDRKLVNANLAAAKEARELLRSNRLLSPGIASRIGLQLNDKKFMRLLEGTNGTLADILSKDMAKEMATGKRVLSQRVTKRIHEALKESIVNILDLMAR